MNAERWIRLSTVPALGPARIKSLWERFGDIDRICNAGVSELAEVSGIGNPTAEKIVAGIAAASSTIDLGPYHQQDITILTLEDRDYPELLREIYDPPTVLYVKGGTAFQKNALAIVGTRRMTAYGKKVTHELIRDLPDFTIISGLAEGIDTEAHKAAIQYGRPTVAVVASGLDMVYPPENRALAEKILESGGSMVSEYPLGEPPENWNFPRRNRIISGMTVGTVVVEAGEESGALITARLALEQGREVFAVPGPVGSPKSMGTNNLIKAGAKLTEGAADILVELDCVVSCGSKEKKELDLSDTERRVMQLLSYDTRHIDDLGNLAGLSTAELNSALTILELKGLVEQQPGKMFRSII